MKNRFLKLVTFLLLLAVWYPSNAQQWEILDPLPEGSSRYRCHFINANDGWVFRTGNFQLLRTRDGGKTWTELYPMTGMRYIFMTDTLVGYMIVQENTLKLFKTNDGGNNWQLLNLQFGYYYDEWSSPIKPIYFINKNVGFVANVNTYMKTTDGGETWIEMELPYNSSGPVAKIVNNITFINDSVGWIAANTSGVNGRIFYTTNQGANWISLNIGWVNSEVVFSELDALNKDTILITGYQFGYADYYGNASITKDNFNSYSWYEIDVEPWRKGIFINDTTVLFYGYNKQNIGKIWTKGIDNTELIEDTLFQGTMSFQAALRTQGAVFLHDGYTIAKRVDTAYVSIPYETITQEKLILFPNPSYNKLNIKLPHNATNGKITITNLTGQVVLLDNIEQIDKQIDITKLSSGVHLITVITDNKRFCEKFIKL
ncbi:MAG: T9SS type A sorting domain-containing protein [Bacteroidales bacterium]|nr:T9SS type A sorting domain-containing protein [Bacteroidales bacterium]